ncbi:VTT domain-containing protein [Amycolatopsis rhabdoformis]|uniref:VTT domain-containing protein n=1 Tax=Amycolatopsis rhabdoformis TaxID=1448059 RepID=A0ABZ1I3D7_9PSEU|nr:VTT domain-containing protein [Amycolatopsis rhabdoformis]WSE28919.1 VTT domain-containing protein [Amycolatopsis rhabdoformis]
MELLQHVTDLLRGALGSPWLWVLVFAVAGLDALLPFMPSETTVVTVAVLLGPDPQRLALLALVAAAGAWAGDCLGYGVGRAAGPRAIERLQRGPQGRQRHEWARAQVRRQAPLLIIAARYLPGGRVASALATGSLGYPLRRFMPLDAIGAAVWAVYSVLIGLVGGATFADEPVKGLLLSFVLGLGLVSVIEFGRRLRLRRLRSQDAPDRGDRRPRRPAEDGGTDGRPGGAVAELSEVDNPRPGDAPDDPALVHGRGDHGPTG